MKKKKGISLIVLIITIIVVIILAVTVILTINKNNPIESSKEAVFKEDVRAFQDDLNMYISNEYTRLQGQRDSKITAKGYGKDGEKDSVYTYIPDFKKKYEGKLAIKEDMIEYIGTDEKEKQWLLNSGVYVSKTLTLNYVDGNGNKLLESEKISLLDNEYRIEVKKIDGYLPLDEVIEGNTSTDIEINVEYCAICNDLAFKGLNSSSKETDNEDEIVAYEVAGIGNCNNPNIAIPREYNNKPVIHIKQSAFAFNQSIKSLIVEDNIKTWGVWTFRDCQNLKKIKINSSRVGNDAFWNCKNLVDVFLGENVKILEAYSFEYCEKLTKIKIPNNVESIQQYVFKGCTNLKEIDLQSPKITSFNLGFLENCNKLDTFIFPEDAYYIEDNILYTKNKQELLLMLPQNKIEDYTVNNEVLYIRNGACSYSNIKNLKINNNVKSIADNGFYGCSKLETIDIDIVLAGTNSFMNCTNLKNAKLSIETTGFDMFWNCTNIQSVTFDSKLKRINGYLFENCPKLTEIQFLGTIEQWESVTKDGNWKKNSNLKVVKCTDGDLNL